MKRPTQSDVARVAGVSRATVSYVINGRADGRVSTTEETRQRVLLAVEQLDYQPDASAQSLRLGKTGTIGVLIPDMHNPHYWQIVYGVEEEARARGYDLFLSSTALDPDRELGSMRALLQRRIDGLVLLLTFRNPGDEAVAALIRQRSPVVLVGGKDDAPDLSLDVVEPDHGTGAIALMAHLLALGHRRIGLVHGVAAPHLAAERMAAYARMLRAAGVEPDETLIQRCGPSLPDGYEAALRLLDRSPRPTAIVAINDYLALGVLRAAADRGLRVPADLSVAGFDDIEITPYLCPALTTVRVNAEELGRRALRLVLERIHDAQRPPQHVRIPAALVSRESTGPAPCQTKPAEPAIELAGAMQACYMVAGERDSLG